ncbi:MAG: CAP domain-containing protein [Bacillota bacterium]|nr:CAP domain-containing protein [Bacillota bacterium]
MKKLCKTLLAVFVSALILLLPVTASAAENENESAPSCTYRIDMVELLRQSVFRCLQLNDYAQLWLQQQLANKTPEPAAGEQTVPALQQTIAEIPAVTAYAESVTETRAFAEEVVQLCNIERSKQGLASLTIDETLMQAAHIRAVEVQEKFSHTRPNGTICFTALQEIGYSYRTAGENIAIGQQTPSEVVEDWMNSQGHRENILNRNYRRIGVGVVISGDDVYQGYSWAQFFSD